MKKRKVLVHRELVLLYHLGEETETGVKLRALLRQMELPFRTLEEEETGCALGYVAKINGFQEGAPAPQQPPKSELMLMKGFTEKALDALLLGMKQQKIEIYNKAILTQTNVKWTVAELMEALEEEHQTMVAYEALRQKVEKAQAIGRADCTEEQWKTLQAAIKQVIERTKYQPTLETVQQAAEEFEGAVSGLMGE